MPQEENYFEILGIPMDAGFDVIEQGYRQARKQFAEDPRRLELIEKAYRTLINPFKKDAYLNQIRKTRGQAAPAQPVVEEPPSPSRRRGTSVYGVEGKSEPEGGEGQKPGGAGRNKTQIVGSGSTGMARAPEPKPIPAGPVAPRSPQPESEPPPGKSRSKTQIVTGGPAAGSRTPEPKVQPPSNQPHKSANPDAQVPGPSKPGGRTKTQIVGAAGAPSGGTPEPAVQKPSEKPTPPPPATGGKPTGGRTKTVVVGAGPQAEPANSGQPATPKGGTVIVPPAGQPAEPGPKKREVTGLYTPEVPVEPSLPAGKVGRPETQPLSPPIRSDERTLENPPQISRHPIEQKWQVVIIYQGETNVFPLHPGENLVGRPPLNGPTPPVPLPDPEKFISRTHATFSVEAGIVTIRDNGSPNGSVLNGSRMVPNQPLPFKEGDVLMIEGREIRIRPAGIS